MNREPVTISSAAAARICDLAAIEAAPLLLRVTVDGGGCSGFQYRFDLIAQAAPDDLLVSRDGAQVAIDPVSLPLLLGSEVDFVDDLVGAEFRIRNPNARSSCGCGVSFSI